MSEELKKIAAVTSLNRMMSKGWLDICTIDSIAKMLGVSPPKEPHQILHTLHCVNFGEMPAELKQAIPSLIKACLDIEPDFRFPQDVIASRVDRVVDITPEPKKAGLLRLLGR